MKKVHNRQLCGCDKYQLCIWLRMEVVCVKELQTFKQISFILHSKVFCSLYTPLNHFTWMIREALPYRCFPTATHSHQDKPHLSFASEGCLERWSGTSWSGERKKGHICTCFLQPVWLYKILLPDCGESGFWFEDDDILMNCKQWQRNMKCNCDTIRQMFNCPF